MSDVHMPYKYSPLLENDSIRLLIIQPGQPGSEIHCDLIHTTISDCHDSILDHYTALSYVWGDANDKRTIFVDKVDFQVTSNLFDALGDIRDEQKSVKLWSDAVCIDQLNFPERSKQVGLMREIYSCASFTIVYLGKSNHACDEVLAAANGKKLNRRSRDIITSQILTRPWFMRVWIYQELILSRVPLIQCGRTRIRWDLLHAALFGDSDAEKPKISTKLYFGENTAKQTVRREDESPDGHRNMKVVKIFSNMHDARDQKRGPPSLLSILLSRRNMGVTDLRDLIYGHLAVADLPSKLNIPKCPVIDYRRSVTDVFTDATIYMLQKDAPYSGYDTLLHTETLDRLDELPSWVPDWSSSSSSYATDLPSVEVSFPTFSASEFPGKWGQVLPPEFPWPRICVVRLYRVGAIEWVGNCLTPGMEDDPTQAAVKKAFFASRLKRKSGWGEPDANQGRNDTDYQPNNKNSRPDNTEHQLNNLYADEFIQEAIENLTGTGGPGSQAPNILEGRKLGQVSKFGYHICVLPRNANTGDIIFAIPRQSHKQWDFLVLRSVFKKGLKMEDLSDWYPPEISQLERHFRVIGRALVQESALGIWLQRSVTPNETEVPGKQVILH